MATSSCSRRTTTVSVEEKIALCDLAASFEDFLRDESDDEELTTTFEVGLARSALPGESKSSDDQPPLASATFVLAGEIHGIIARSWAPTSSIGCSLPASADA